MHALEGRMERRRAEVTDVTEASSLQIPLSAVNNQQSKAKRGEAQARQERR